MFELGKYIRKRYKKFLGTSPREVYIRSSEIDRCLESVSLVVAGLYPPKGRFELFLTVEHSIFNLSLNIICNL